LEPIELLCDNGLSTLKEYWEAYKTKWKPLEESTNGEWRKDFGFDQDGKKKRGRSSWWTQRVGMFKVVEYHIENVLSEDDALLQAGIIFDGACRTPRKKPAIKDLNVAFKREMDRLGIKSTGRPKGSGLRKKQGRAAISNHDDFGNAFDLNASQQLYLEQVEMESEEYRFHMEQHMEQEAKQADMTRIQANEKARWEHVHRYQTGPAPPMPPGGYNGTLHALPFHPYIGLPPPPLPDGHSYASLP
jgi:hypothetical protein